MINHPNRNRAKKVAATQPARSGKAKRVFIEYDHSRDYPAFERAVLDTFRGLNVSQLFCTDVDGDEMWTQYLERLPSDRQTHNCHACRHFISRFGGLAVIGEGGQLFSAMWNGGNVPEFYRPFTNWARDRVQTAKVTGPFYSSAKELGIPVTGEWSHLAVIQNPLLMHPRGKLTAEQRMAAKREDFKNIKVALADPAFKPHVLDEAIRVLNLNALNRADHFLAPAEWMRKLHDRPKDKRGDAILWGEVAHAPDGFCHPRSGMLGQLCDAIAAGRSFEAIKRFWNEQVAGENYQRPKAAPTMGQVTAAEKLVAKLGIERSLERRFARLEDVRKLWEPRSPAWSELGKPGGVFDHLKPGISVKPLDVPPQVMTWAKFSSTILPDVEQIEFKVPHSGAFSALVTAVHADAPPILKWDHENDRYPVSSYRYVHPSPASRWNLAGGSWAKVNAIALSPGGYELVMLILDGARDSGNAGSALFPEILKSELHEIRSTIEAHSNATNLAGREEASACGYPLPGGTIRVLMKGAWTPITIDRWD